LFGDGGASFFVTNTLAPSENRSHNSADGRVATEAAWLNGGKSKNHGKSKQKLSTAIGLLMEGLGS
jgi:hypothetical protein